MPLGRSFGQNARVGCFFILSAGLLQARDAEQVTMVIDV
jgi:hypothetical protein